jgi:hypothetical protein
MTITVDWDDAAKSTVLYKYTGRWNWDEYAAATKRGLELATSVDYVLDVIADFTDTSMMPSNAMSNLRNSWQQRVGRYHTIVLVTRSTFFDALMSVFKRINSEIANKIYVVKSIDEARTLLLERRK